MNIPFRSVLICSLIGNQHNYANRLTFPRMCWLFHGMEMYAQTSFEVIN